MGISFSTVWKNIQYWQTQVSQLEQENQELQEALRPYILPDPPLIVHVKTSLVVVEIVERDTGGVTPFLLDSSYRIPDEEDFLRFLQDSRAKREHYVAEAFDCDNFALEFMSDCLKWGSNCALITGDSMFGSHAWNGAVVARGSSLLFTQVEPQAGLIVNGYTPQWVMLGG